MATAVKSKAILKRAPVLIGAPAEKIEKLAISAKLVLGYHRLADLITTPKRLITVLRELEIEPYTQSTVEAYKVSKVQEVRAEIARRKEKNSQRFRSSLRATWKRTDIDRYKRIVPEFALRKAVMIKEACPDAVIEVDALVIERVRTYDSHASSTSDPDPFLVASLGAERYYIEVWDEKKFEDKLY
jgi:hypothetical protein